MKAPNFHDDGTLKIMQSELVVATWMPKEIQLMLLVADLHYSVGTGKCRDTDKTPCSGDPDTAAWLAEALDAEKPDLVVSTLAQLQNVWSSPRGSYQHLDRIMLNHQVFSGDQLNGQSTSYDSRSVLAKFARPVIERQIPWTAIFGAPALLTVRTNVANLTREP